MIFDENAEKTLIGALVQHDNPSGYLLALSEEDMTFEAHKVLLSAMQRLCARREPFDMGVVAAEAEKDDRAALCNPGMVIVDCMCRAPSAVMTQQYYDRVRDLSSRRSLQRISQGVYEAAADPTQDAAALIAGALEDLRRIGAGKDRWQDMAVLAAMAFEDVERRSKGEMDSLKTGVADLDRVTGGLFPGEVTILGARPAVGKSALAAFMATNIAAKGGKVGVCSLEMHPLQYLKRLIAAYGNVDGHKLRTGKHLSTEEWERIGEACETLSGLNMPFTFQVRTVEELAAEARRRKDTRGLDLLVVDYLQLLRLKRPVESEFARVTAVSHDIKQLALDLEIPILALAQVTRPERKGVLEMPTMDCLRGSGDIEQDADNIVFLHRPTSEADSSIKPRHFSIAKACMDDGPNRYLVCNIAKQRDGDNRMFDMIFDPSHMTFRCLAD